MGPLGAPIVWIIGAVIALTLIESRVLLNAATDAAEQEPGDGAFAFFNPTIVVSPEERSTLDRGRSLVRVIPTRNGHIGVFAAVRLDAPGENLAAQVARIEQLKKSEYVRSIRRLSDPPTPSDLEGLVLDDSELDDIVKCRPASCALKLTEAEITTLRQVVEQSGDEWRDKLQAAFRHVVWERIEAYRRDGQRAFQPYADDPTAHALAPSFDRIVKESPYLVAHVPELVAYLTDYPRKTLDGVDSFLYWSIEKLGPKPMVVLTHVAILRRPRTLGMPEVLVAGKQVFATHYTNASLSVTAVLPSADGAYSYLTYLNRSETDALGGFLSWVKRPIAERRIRNDADVVLTGVKRRVEGSGATAGRD